MVDFKAIVLERKLKEVERQRDALLEAAEAAVRIYSAWLNLESGPDPFDTIYEANRTLQAAIAAARNKPAV